MSDDEITQPSQMPPQPTTKEIPAAKPEDILLAELRNGFRTVNSRLDSQDATLDKVVTEGIESNVRLTRIEVRVEGAEARVGDLESRIGRTSTRVREGSQADLEQAAQFAQALTQLGEERAKREALEKAAATKDDVKRMLDEAAKEQTGIIVTAVETLVKTPTAQKLKAAIVPVLLIAISVIGVKLTMLLNKLQESPPTQQTQTITITASPDAGVKP